MKKISLLFTVILFTCTVGYSQAYESFIQYDKKKQQGIAIDYSYSAEAVENAIVQKLSRMGYKAKEEKGILNKDKGFLVYKNIYITDISRDRMDFMIKVERKSRKESDEAVLYMIMMKGGQNALASMEAYAVGNAKSFLNNLLPDIEEANLELEIKAQEDVVNKAEKKLSGLQKDKLDLEDKLARNEKSQEETLKDIESQKQNLELLRGKRKKD
ncbi:MAG TPA: hypothetical protein VMZ03_12460 [Chitinophagaceae bacterium]|nr:hypothetical protein [Chitinophagaceae bacterium]